MIYFNFELGLRSGWKIINLEVLDAGRHAERDGEVTSLIDGLTNEKGARRLFRQYSGGFLS